MDDLIKTIELALEKNDGGLARKWLTDNPEGEK